jgi:hypothetical protein
MVNIILDLVGNTPMEPAWSQVIGRGLPGHHSKIWDRRRLGAEERLLVGISFGANVVTALRLACEMGSQKAVVTVLPDRGDRYAELPA